MSVAITGRILNSQVDQRASLGNDQILRFIEPLGTWNKIRIGMRFTTNASANITGTPRLYVGMCNGVESHVSGAGSETTRNFVGVVTNDATWTYGTGTGAGDGINYVQPDELRGVSRVGTTNTLTSASSGGCIFSASPQVARCCFFVTIDKTTPAATSVEMLYADTVSSGLLDIALTDFFTQLESETVVTLNDYERQVFGSTLSIDEGTNGALNAVNVSWSKFPNRIEISDISYHVFS